MINAINEWGYYEKTTVIKYICKQFRHGRNIKFLTLGVDMPEITHLSQPSSNSIAFSGVMDYGPNEDAAYFFATEIFHKIKSEIPDAKFVIVGKNPTNKLKIIESKSIVLTGFVKDITTAITQSEIYSFSFFLLAISYKNSQYDKIAFACPISGARSRNIVHVIELHFLS